jgi:hypothetical protein
MSLHGLALLRACGACTAGAHRVRGILGVDEYIIKTGSRARIVKEL